MSKTCYAIRHVHFEDLGSFADPIREAGYGIHYLEAPVDDLSPARDADLTILLGGPLAVYDHEAYPFLDWESELVAHRLKHQKPMIGLCLGAQIIAHAAGARVYPGEHGLEVGWRPIQLTEAGKQSALAPLAENGAQMFHWHGDSFDLPKGATLLASTELYAHQIFSMDDYVLAFQCHPELDPNNIEHWLVGHAFELARVPETTADTLRADTRRYGDGLARRTGEMLSNWLSNLENL